MTYQPGGYRKGYDIDFDKDLERGHEGERLVDKLMRSRDIPVFRGTMEAKNDHGFYETGNVYVEFNHQPPGRPRGESGILVTTAPAWAFVLSEEPDVVAVIVSVPALLAAVVPIWDGHGSGGWKARQRRGDVPTWGVALRGSRLLSLGSRP